MIEVGIAIGAVALLGFGGLVAPLVGPESWVDWGLALFWLGMAFGVPTGAWYHVRLAQVLRPIGALPRTWWIRPTSLHGELPPAQRAGVLFWCRLGALGFGVAMLGCLCVATGVVLEARRAGVL